MVLNKLKPWLSEVMAAAGAAAAASNGGGGSTSISASADNVEDVLQLRERQETLVSLTQLATKYKV